MEKYIFQILESNSRVIVPEFGAFIVKQRSPLTIVFNEFLQYNDGMLVDTISKGEGITRDEAKAKIDAFVKKITIALDKGSEFTIEGLGILVKNSTGKISLVDEAGYIPKKQSSTVVKEKETSKKAETTEDKIAAPERKAEPETKVEPDKSAEPKKSESISSSEKALEKPVEKTAEPSPTAKENKVSAKASEEKSKDEAPKSEQKIIPEEAVKKEPPQSVRKPESGTETTKYVVTDETRKRSANKKRNNVVLWVIIILVINAGIVAYFYSTGHLDGLFRAQSDLEELMPVEEEENDLYTDTAPAMDPMIEEQVTPVPTTPERILVPRGQTSITGTRYYIVAGVFSVESNANRLVEELLDEGYDAEKFGKIGNMHAVSYGVWSSRAEANKNLNKIRQERNAEAWIKVID
jgi:nucleoid DNA-binding protein